MKTALNSNHDHNTQNANARLSVYDQLDSLIGEHLTSFYDDLHVHDKAIISCTDNIRFIHVTHCSGTHLFPLPVKIDCDEPVKYLFGFKRPSDIYKEILSCLEDYFGRPDYFGYSHYFCYSNGNEVVKVTQDRAIDLYRTALRSSLRNQQVDLRIKDC